MNTWRELASQIGYVFRNEALLRLAMTHTSYANERSGKHHGESNQRLEFLGDSVLSTVVSTYLYARFPEMPEGKLSRLRASVVCEPALAAIAERIGLSECLLLGNGEEQTGGRTKPSILADAMESLIAAIYLDSDYSVVTDVLMNRIGMQAIVDRASEEFEKVDYKTALQEFYREPDVQIKYAILGVDGPPHNCVYTAQVTLRRGEDAPYTAEAHGKSKKEAEQQAAKCLLSQLS